MKKAFIFLLLLPFACFGQRQISDGTKTVKLDVVYLISELYHTHSVYVNDFRNTVSTSSAGNDVQATNSGTGAATSAVAAPAVGRPSWVRSTTGTTATGRTAVNTAATAVLFGGGSWIYETAFRVNTLSNATERYQLLIGFFDTYTAANQVDGAYILYDEGGVSTGSSASANWQTVTSSNSVRTFNQNSENATAVAQASDITVRIEINAAGNQAIFKVNGVVIGTHTSTIPLGIGRDTGFGWMLIKSVGTTARTVDFDFISCISALTTSR